MTEKELADRIAYCWQVIERAADRNAFYDDALELKECIGFLREQFKPIELDNLDFDRIKDFGISAFHTSKDIPTESKQAQVYLILKGLIEFLLIKKKLPTFKVDPDET